MRQGRSPAGSVPLGTLFGTNTELARASVPHCSRPIMPHHLRLRPPEQLLPPYSQAWPSRHHATKAAWRPLTGGAKDIPGSGGRTRPGGKSTSCTLQIHPTPQPSGPMRPTHDSEPIPPIHGSRLPGVKATQPTRQNKPIQNRAPFGVSQRRQSLGSGLPGHGGCVSSIQ